MGRTNKILIAVDDSEASMKAVTYVSKLVRGRESIHVCLFHVLPPIPPKLLEFGGAEDPQQEARLSAELKTAQAEWLEKAKNAAQPSLEAAQIILKDHGLSQHRISTRFSSSIHKPDVVREVLEAAKESHCGTVVVGRHRLPWVEDIFYRHTGEELVEKGQEFSVWVVG
ncbi:MAG TPA: universal stress protein [Nitrospiraceae bacterium]|nr:universal stress protein [Nitrospiraceae bacterium]